MVPVPTAPVGMAAACVVVGPPTAPSVTVTFSLASTTASGVMFTLIACVSPAPPAESSGVVAATLSSLPPAVPLAALKATVKPPCTAALDVTVNVIVVVPPVPSVTVGLVMLKNSLSSIVMVPVPTAPVVMAAACVGVVPPTAPSVTVNCSLASTMASVVMFLLFVCVSPAVPSTLSLLVALPI